jgi:hypothetical protein
MTTNKKNETVETTTTETVVPTTTETRVVTIDKAQMPEVFAKENTEWFVTKRAEVDAYITELQNTAGELRKNFDRLLEMAKGRGFATEVAPLRKPREKNDPADMFSFL